MTSTKKNQPPLARDAILGTAIRLFQQRGLGGLGMRQIADHLHIRAPSLYHHFPSKEDLARQAMQQYREEQATRLRDIEEQGTLAEQLHMYAALFAEMLEDGHRLCMYLIMVHEPSFQEQACIDELKQFTEQNVGWLEQILRAGKENYPSTASVGERDLAELIFASFEGNMAVSLLDKSPSAAFRQRADNFLKLVVGSTGMHGR